MAMREKQPKESGMGLSFLDVLCCGLGASVLLLLIVKHEPDIPGIENLSLMAAPEINNLEIRVDRLEQSLKQKNLIMARLQEQERDVNFTNSILDELNLDAQRELREIQKKITSARARNASLVGAISQAEAQIKKEKIELPVPVSEATGALDGVEMRGIDKAVIILDVSASMLHWSLVEIFRAQALGNINPMSFPKWKQASLAARYAYQTINQGARFQFILFSDVVLDIAGNELNSKNKLSWQKKNSVYNGQILSKGSVKHDLLVDKALRKVRVSGGTNLQKAIESISSLVPRPEKILLITDGLPNKLERMNLRNTGLSCPINIFGLRKSNKVRTVSGKCRFEIGIESVEKFSNKLSRVPVDIVLLPLEGDPLAVRFYTLLAGQSGGKVITPSYDWLIN